MGMFSGSRRFIRKMLRWMFGGGRPQFSEREIQQNQYRVELEAVAKCSEEFTSNIVSAALIFGMALTWGVYYDSSFFANEGELFIFVLCLSGAQSLAVVSMCIFTASFNATKSLTAQMLADSDVEDWEIQALRTFRQRILKLTTFGRISFWVSLAFFLLASLIYKWTKIPDDHGAARGLTMAASVLLFAVTIAAGVMLRRAQRACEQQLRTPALPVVDGGHGGRLLGGGVLGGLLGQTAEQQAPEQDEDQDQMRSSLEAIDSLGDEFTNNAVVAALLYTFTLTWIMDYSPVAFMLPTDQPAMDALYMLFMTLAEVLFSFCMVVFTMSFNVTKSITSQVLSDSEISAAELDAVRAMGKKMQQTQEVARWALYAGLVVFNVAALLYLLVKVPDTSDNAITRWLSIISIVVGTIAFLAAVAIATKSYRNAYERIQKCNTNGVVSEEDKANQWRMRMELESVDKRGEESVTNTMLACLIMGFSMTWLVDYVTTFFEGHTTEQSVFIVVCVFCQATGTFSMVIFMLLYNICKRLSSDMCSDAYIESEEMHELRTFLLGPFKKLKGIATQAFWASLITYMGVTLCYIAVKADAIKQAVPRIMAFIIVPICILLVVMSIAIIIKSGMQARSQINAVGDSSSEMQSSMLAAEQSPKASRDAEEKDNQTKLMAELEAYEQKSDEWSSNAVAGVFVWGFTFTWLMNYDQNYFADKEVSHVIFMVWLLLTQGFSAMSMVVFTLSRSLVMRFAGHMSADATFTDSEMQALRCFMDGLMKFQTPARYCFLAGPTTFLLTALVYIVVKVPEDHMSSRVVGVVGLALGVLLLIVSIVKVSMESSLALRDIRAASAKAQEKKVTDREEEEASMSGFLGLFRRKKKKAADGEDISEEVRTELEAVESRSEEWGMNGVSASMVFGFATLWILDYKTSYFIGVPVEVQILFDNGTVSGTETELQGGSKVLHLVYTALVVVAVSCSAFAMMLFTMSFNAVKTLLCELMVDASVEEDEMTVLRRFLVRVMKVQHYARGAFWVSLAALLSANILYISQKAPEGQKWVGAASGALIGVGTLVALASVIRIARLQKAAIVEMEEGDEAAGKEKKAIAADPPPDMGLPALPGGLAQLMPGKQATGGQDPSGTVGTVGSVNDPSASQGDMKRASVKSPPQVKLDSLGRQGTTRQGTAPPQPQQSATDAAF